MSRVAVGGEHDILALRASNPSPFTLTGTNSWIVGRTPAWLIDPGPALDEHIEALIEELEARGGLAGVALTHDHHDHCAAVPAMRARYPQARLAAARGDVDLRVSEGRAFGPLVAVMTPGHAPDHVAYAAGTTVFTGDAVLGEGSVFVAPYPGALRAYLESLQRLRQRRPALLCPGHGPPISDPMSKLDGYIAHRLERERRLVDALGRGRRTVDELLADAWSDAPANLRVAAAVTLAAHLDKLEEEGRLPPGVERPETPF